MPELTNYTIWGVRCDATGCDESVSGPERCIVRGRDEYEHEAVRMGWTIWVGRNRRYYCPSHGPAKGHTMQLVAGGGR